MSKLIDELSKNLASGMSRRRAFGRCFAGIGVAAGALLTGKKAFAAGNSICAAFCAGQHLRGRDFAACVAASAECPAGNCALVMNGGSPVCVPVS
jgi:hypothetical protein